MPYIKQEQRPKFNPELAVLAANISEQGELNYVITNLVKSFIKRRGGNYAAHSDAIGVLECVKLELYRRSTGPYEDECIKRNGDI
jgi:hypothetical protein